MANKVLVVDDEKLIVKGIKFSLEQDGMEVTAAYDGKEAYELAMQNDYDIIDIMVAGGKYGTANECSIIDSTVQHTRLMLNLLSEQQFYGYVNYIAGERICYRMPCVYGWSEHNNELVSVMKDFIEDNMPQIWECIITDTLKERCSVLYEKMCGIRKKVLKNFQRFIRGIGIGNEKWAYKEQQGKQD